MNLVTYTCPNCKRARKLKFRAGKVDTNKHCHRCASTLMREGDNNWFKHNAANTDDRLLYQVWCGMKQRCYYAKARAYAYYGARGIIVDARWKNDFIAFRDWARANGYAKGLILDRRDGNKNYCPENCRWIEQYLSGSNLRNNVIDAVGAAIIKDLAHGGTPQKLIAALFNIKPAYVSTIKTGRAWAWATPTMLYE
jgi:hypothetical protein